MLADRRWPPGSCAWIAAVRILTAADPCRSRRVVAPPYGFLSRRGSVGRRSELRRREWSPPRRGSTEGIGFFFSFSIFCF